MRGEDKSTRGKTARTGFDESTVLFNASQQLFEDVIHVFARLCRRFDVWAAPAARGGTEVAETREGKETGQTK